MKTIVTVTAFETKFWSAAIRTAAYFLGNGFTVPQPRPKLKTYVNLIRTIEHNRINILNYLNLFVI